MFKIRDSEEISLKKATAINAGSKYTVVILGLLFSAVLARLLTPKDYGIVAVVTVFTNFFSLFSDMGIGTAVIQNKKLTDEDENKIFTFTIFLGMILCVVFSAFSFVLVYLYKKKIYYIIAPLLGISLALTTFNMVPNAKLMKSKRFILVAFRTIISCIIGYLFAILVAFLGGKYYAIILQSIITATFCLLWNLKSSKLKFCKGNVFISVKKIWSFSSYQFGFNIINYFSRNLDNLLTGYYFGDVMLGFYDKAYRLMRYPVDNLTNVITPSIQPILSDHQDDVKYVLCQYNKIAKFLSVIAIYISAVCFFASKEVILLYFGQQWEGAIVCFHYLSAGLFFQIVGGVSGSIYQCVNKTKAMFWSGIIGSIITVVAIIIGISFGSIELLALCYSIGFVLNFVKSQWFLGHFCFDESVFKLTIIYLPELVIFAVMCVVMYFIPTFDNLLLSFIIKFIVCSITYIIMLFVSKEYKILIAALPSRITSHLPKCLQG